MPNETTTYAPTGAVAIARRPEPVPAPTMTELEAMLSYATTMSQAVQCLPPAYQKQPGAILIVQEWAKQHGVTLLEAMQSVAFVKGKPVVDATMQRALAERAGYSVEVQDGATEATAIVKGPRGVEVGRVTYTLDDAKKAGLTDKDNWRKHTREMLVAAATRLAIRWHAPSVLIGVGVVDDINDLEAAAPSVAPLAPAPEPEATVADVVDAEIVPGGPIGDPFTAVGVPESEPEPVPAADAVDEAELRARLKAERVSLSTFIPAVQLVAKGRGLATVSTLAEACALGEGVIAEALESLRT